MINVEKLHEIIGADFYTGVPDSQLKPLCDYLMDTYGIDPLHHVIAANEGNSVAIAAGYHLATGRAPVVYMQNSGQGNIINPVASLLNEKVYGIPMLFIIGWRGEPGAHDEPQHIFQGQVTLRLLEDMEVAYHVIGTDAAEEEIALAMERFRTVMAERKDAAFVIRKGAVAYGGKAGYHNPYEMQREEVIRCVTKEADEDPIIATTGKASRELFEIREGNGQPHKYDFLTVGSMGHSSSIALGVALQRPDRRIWCIDGDGAALMHMGAMAVIGSLRPRNLVHIVINNGAHETVGGMPTVAAGIRLAAVAEACGYPHAVSVERYDELKAALQEAKARRELSLIEVKCAIGSRKNLGRPTSTAAENKRGFMEYLGVPQTKSY